MAWIISVRAREILDSRGNPTIEADVILDDGARGRAAVPSGASTGKRKALELRDADPARYAGKGVTQAVRNVNETISPALHMFDAMTQVDVDRRLCEMDGTKDKSQLGANAILAVSMATAQAAASSSGMPLYRYLGGVNAHVLPVPMFNVLNGGAHANNSVDCQEFMIMPSGAPTFREALRVGAEVYHALASLLDEQGHSTAVGDEGGFAPNLRSNEEGLDLVVKAIERAGLRPGRDMVLALDMAASELFENGGYVFRKSDGGTRTSDDLVRLYSSWLDNYPLWSIEDPMDQEDWQGWKTITSELAGRVQLVGDDIFVTNAQIIRRAVAEHVGNAALIKLNQIGTVTETLDAINEARIGEYDFVISHRSGETPDAFIADLAVATGAGQIKTGAPCRGERVAKYNQLLRIEDELGTRTATPDRNSVAACANPRRDPCDKLHMDLHRPIVEYLRKDFSRLDARQTVREALETVRRQPPPGRIIYFYVVDEEQHIEGVLPARRLLLSDPETVIADIMVRQVISIPQSATVLEACEFFVMHRLLAFPVVDDAGRCLGIVDVEVYTDEISELDEAQRGDDLFQLVGVHLAESQQASPVAAFRSRFPWLLCNIGGGITAAFLSGLFQAELERIVAIALFIPVVLALAESVSIQSVSLALQVMHGQRPTVRALGVKLRRELATSAMLGWACATLVAGVASFGSASGGLRSVCSWESLLASFARHLSAWQSPMCCGCCVAIRGWRRVRWHWPHRTWSRFWAISRSPGCSCKVLAARRENRGRLSSQKLGNLFGRAPRHATDTSAPIGVCGASDASKTRNRSAK